MNTKYHKEVLEALGMMATKDRIVNKLNSAYSKSDDPKLREFASTLINEVKAASSNTKAFSLKDLKNGVPTALASEKYCKSVVFGESAINTTR